MPSYSFSFDPAASGLPYVVTDRAGVEVDDGTLDSSNDVVNLTLDLPWGSYTARAAAPGATYVSTPAFFAGAEQVHTQPGATETAYLIATGPTDISDGSGAAGTLTWEADPAHGELPTWASIDEDNNILLTEEAGGMAYSFAGVYDFDFSATTPQTNTGNLSVGFTLKIDGAQVFVDTTSTPGNGLDNQTTNAARQNGVLPAGSVVLCEASPFADDVADAAVSPRVGLNLTRILPAANVPAA